MKRSVGGRMVSPVEAGTGADQEFARRKAEADSQFMQKAHDAQSGPFVSRKNIKPKACCNGRRSATQINQTLSTLRAGQRARNEESRNLGLRHKPASKPASLLFLRIFSFSKATWMLPQERRMSIYPWCGGIASWQWKLKLTRNMTN